MTELKTQIIDALRSDSYRPVDAQKLAKQIRVKKKHMSEFREAIDAMAQAGTIRVGKKGRIRLKASAGFIAGVVKKIASGAGFVIPT